MYSFFVFCVVFVVVFSAFFSSAVVSAFCAAVGLSVMLFGEFFSAVGTFSFGVFDVNFHVYHCFKVSSILSAVFSPIPGTLVNCW